MVRRLLVHFDAQSSCHAAIQLGVSAWDRGSHVRLLLNFDEAHHGCRLALARRCQSDGQPRLEQELERA